MKIWLLVVLSVVSAVHAAPKLILTDIVNKDKKTDYDYLTASITDAVREKLKGKFVYNEMPKETYLALMQDNYLAPDETDSYSVCMNLGLLARQDVVIGGSFRVAAGRGGYVIHTHVRILDITTKKQVTEFTESGPADASIFATVDVIANRIVQEASAVLPNKDEWEKHGSKYSNAKQPWLDEHTLALTAGYGVLAGGVGSRVQAEPPALTLSWQFILPRLSDNFGIRSDFGYFRLSPKAGANPALSGLTVSSSNFSYSGSFFYTIRAGKSWGISPFAGGGGVMQMNTVSGLTDTYLIAFPIATAGAFIQYKISPTFSLVGLLTVMAQIEPGTITLFNLLQLGASYRL
jgi:hypothetical protein